MSRGLGDVYKRQLKKGTLALYLEGGEISTGRDGRDRLMGRWKHRGRCLEIEEYTLDCVLSLCKYKRIDMVVKAEGCLGFVLWPTGNH